MNAVILAALILGQPPAKPADPVASLDGNWIVLGFEKSGEAVAEAKDCLATIKDNVIVYMPKNEKTAINAMKLAFSAQSTLEVTEVVPKVEEANPPKPRAGVYVMTRDYLAISIRDTVPAPQGATPPAASNSKPNAAPFCTVILKRVPLPERK